MDQRTDNSSLVAELPSKSPTKYLFRMTEAGHTELVEIDHRPDRLAAGYGRMMQAIDETANRRCRGADE